LVRRKVLLIGSEPLRMTRLRRTFQSLTFLGIDVSVFRPSSQPSGRPRLVKGIIRYLTIMLQLLFQKADVYHFYNVPDVLGLPFIIKRGILIYDVRSPWFSSVKETIGIKPIWKIAEFIEKIMTRFADFILTANTPLANRAKMWGAKNVTVVPNYPPSDFGPTIPRHETRKALGLDECPTALYLGKISVLEGSELLKEIIETTVIELESVKFLIVGDGPMRESVEQFVKEKGLSSQVNFVGWVAHRDVANYIEAADICIFPRLWTSFSPYTSPENILKIGEYLALGKPVVAPKMGGFVDAEFPVISVEPSKMGDAVVSYLRNPIPVPESQRPTWQISHAKLKNLYKSLNVIE